MHYCGEFRLFIQDFSATSRQAASHCDHAGNSKVGFFGRLPALIGVGAADIYQRRRNSAEGGAATSSPPSQEEGVVSSPTLYSQVEQKTALINPQNEYLSTYS